MLEVKLSPLHGRGLFASAAIPADTMLGELQTQPAQDHELEGPYVLWVQDDTPVRVTCDLRFINHSAAPNAVYYDDCTVYALRDIEPGEEILHNYLGDAASHSEDDVDFEASEADSLEAEQDVATDLSEACAVPSA